MGRYIDADGHIFHDDDPALVSPLSRAHEKRLNLEKIKKGPQLVRVVQPVRVQVSKHSPEVLGFFAAAAAAAALIPHGAQVTVPAERRPGRAAPRKPQIEPKPKPHDHRELEAELERTRRAMEAAQAQVIAEHAKSVEAMRNAEAAEAARQAAATRNEALLAKQTGDRKAYELAMGKLRAQVTEAERARDRAMNAGDQAAAAELAAAKAEARKAGERAAAELSARKKAEAAVAALEKKERAQDAIDAAAHAAELAEAAAALAALRRDATTRKEATDAEAARLRALAELAEGERQARAKAEAELAATKEALAKLKEAKDTPPAPQVDMTGMQAAIALRYYLQANGTAAGFGYKDHPNDQVQTYQRYLRTGADGIVGPKTRAATLAHGITLPPRPPPPQERGDTSPPRPPSPPPAPPSVPEVPPTPEPEAAVRARELHDYLHANPTRAAFGYRNSPSAPVIRFQRAAGIDDDGIVGPNVRAAAQVHNVSLPARPS